MERNGWRVFPAARVEVLGREASAGTLTIP